VKCQKRKKTKRRSSY